MPCQYHKCQFQVTEGQLYRGSSGDLCVFHAPIERKNSWGKDKKQDFNNKILDLVEQSINDNKTVNLSGVVFPGVIDFSGKSFPISDFSCCKFHDSVYFGSAKFNGRANFRNVTFMDTANFSSAVFEGEIHFTNSIFEHGGDFEKNIFPDFTDFSSVSFKGPAFFLSAEFGKYTLFHSTQFTNTLNLNFAKFNGSAEFINAGFGNSAEFEEAHFNGGADFSSIIENGSNDTFQGLDFHGSRFGNAVDFSNRIFKAKTNFEKTTFTLAPKFYNSSLHQDTIFPPQRYFEDTQSKEAASAYRTLKLAMENVRARREEAMFYALEQRSLRNDPEVSKTSKFISLLYEKTADYGQSLNRPIIYLVVVVLGFFGVYFVVALNYADSKVSICDLAIKTLGFSFKQAFQPFYILRQPSLEWISGLFGIRLVKIAATLESLLILGLFALFLLGLRWHFKRG